MDDFTRLVLCWILFLFAWLIHCARYKFRLSYDNSFVMTCFSIPGWIILLGATAEYIHKTF